jgi:hypothetical protein
MDKIKKREIKRIRHMLDEIVSLAEDEELEGGLPNAVRRYNSIVRHLETAEVLPPGLFQLVSEEQGAVNFHQIAVESRMLSGYLEEVVDEEDEDERTRPDFGPVIALAPFLDKSDLRAMVHTHLSGAGFPNSKPTPGERRPGPPGLDSLVALAPHMGKKDLAQMVEACLAREPVSDPNLLLALAPHLDKEDLGRLLRQHAPGWFDPARQGGAPSAAAPADAGAPPQERFER